jgi:hypothetical protein
VFKAIGKDDPAFRAADLDGDGRLESGDYDRHLKGRVADVDRPAAPAGAAGLYGPAGPARRRPGPVWKFDRNNGGA